MSGKVNKDIAGVFLQPVKNYEPTLKTKIYNDELASIRCNSIMFVGL